MFICDISIFNRYGKQRLDEMLSVLEIDWRVLVAILVINQMPGITQSYLSRFLQTDKANVTKLLQQMEQKEWIRREADLEDHRTKKCTLLQGGIALVPKLQSIMQTWEERCFQGFDRATLDQYRELNRRISQNLMNPWSTGMESPNE